MTIALAILAGLKTAFTAVVGLLAKLPWQFWVCLGLVFCGWWFGHGGGSLRDFCCSKAPKPPVVRTYSVVSCDVPYITVAYGVRDRRQEIVALWGITIPSEVKADANAELERLAGSDVELAEPGAKMEAEVDAIRPPPAIAIGYGREGCLQEGLLSAGLALDTSKRSGWVSAEKAAKKAKKGIWSKGK